MNFEYLKRHNNAFIVLTVEGAKQEGLLPCNSGISKNGAKEPCWSKMARRYAEILSLL